jgi:hypothetical protein
MLLEFGNAMARSLNMQPLRGTRPWNVTGSTQCIVVGNDRAVWNAQNHWVARATSLRDESPSRCW